MCQQFGPMSELSTLVDNSITIQRIFKLHKFDGISSNLYETITNHNDLDTLMSKVYEERKDADGFLYITYTEETTLG